MSNQTTTPQTEWKHRPIKQEWTADMPIGHARVRQVCDKITAQIFLGDVVREVHPQRKDGHFTSVDEAMQRCHEIVYWHLNREDRDKREIFIPPSDISPEEKDQSRMNPWQAVQSDVFDTLGEAGVLAEVGQIKDVDDSISAPRRIRTVLDSLLDAGKIDDRQYVAAEEFRIAYQRAGKPFSQSCDPGRLPGGEFNEYALLRKIDRGDAVWEALNALGGWKSPAGRVAVMVLGEGLSLRNLESDHGIDRAAARLMVVQACFILEAHWNH